MADTLDHVDAAIVTAFVDEMLDDTSDLGELAAAAFRQLRARCTITI